MNFLEKLDYFIKQNNLTKHSLAQNSHIPYTTIINWYKRGYEGLTLASLRKLSDYFKTPITFWIYDEITDPNYSESNNFKISSDEIDHLKKYRSLDDLGKTHIDHETDRELSRMMILHENDKLIQELRNHISSSEQDAALTIGKTALMNQKHLNESSEDLLG